VQVVHADGGGGGLVGLVEPLEDGREHPVGLAEDPGRASYVVGVDTADLRDPLGRVVGDHLLEVGSPQRVRGDP
jgi:hypothetical protein